MSRILLLTTEPLPLSGMPTTGAGLRAWGLAQGLRSAGCDVRLLMPGNAAATFAAESAVAGEKGEAERLRLRARARSGEEEGKKGGECGWPEWVGTFQRGQLADAAREASADAIVLQHWGLARELGEVGVPLAIDLAGPHLLERRLWGSGDPEADLREKLDALRRADFLTCSGTYQRHYFLPFLAMAGWDVEGNVAGGGAEDPLPVIPFSFKPTGATAPARNDRLIYGGFLLPWQDPTTTIEAALAALDATGRGELLFVGGPHPTMDVSRGRFETILERIDAHPRARRLGPMSFDDYLALLAEGGVALDLMARNAERELAYTTRTVVYLAAGLPVLHDDYSELGTMIARAGAGWTLPADGRAAIEALLVRVLKGEEPVDARAAAARRLAERELDWEKTVGPLAAWCAEPAVREGKVAARLAFEEQGRKIERLETELRAAGGERDTLLGKRWVRWGLDLFSLRGWARWPMAAAAALIGVVLIPVFLINDLFGKGKG